MTISSGGKIDVSGKGYQGATLAYADGFGPGKGKYGSLYAGGEHMEAMAGMGLAPLHMGVSRTAH